MTMQWLNFIYDYRSTLHPSWVVHKPITWLKDDSSQASWHLGFQQLCRHFEVPLALMQAKAPEFWCETLPILAAKANLAANLAGYAMIHSDTEQSQRAHKQHTAVGQLSQEDRRWSLQLGRSLALGKRFGKTMPSLPATEDIGIWLLYSAVQLSAPEYWAKLRLSIDINIVNRVELVSGQMKLSAVDEKNLRRLWRCIASHINGDSSMTESSMTESSMVESSITENSITESYDEATQERAL